MFTPVTVLTQPGCRACHRVMQKLDDAEIDYDVVDISLNNEAYTYATQVLKAKAVPVVLTDTHEPIIGYQPEKLDELIDHFRIAEEAIHDYAWEGDND